MPVYLDVKTGRYYVYDAKENRLDLSEDVDSIEQAAARIKPALEKKQLQVTAIESRQAYSKNEVRLKRIYDVLLQNSGLSYSAKSHPELTQPIDRLRSGFIDQNTGVVHYYTLNIYKDADTGEVYVLDMKGSRLDLVYPEGVGKHGQAVSMKDAKVLLFHAQESGQLLVKPDRSVQEYDFVPSPSGNLLKVNHLDSEVAGKNAFAYLVHLHKDVNQDGFAGPDIIYGDPEELINGYAREIGLQPQEITAQAKESFRKAQAEYREEVEGIYAVGLADTGARAKYKWTLMKRLTRSSRKGLSLQIRLRVRNPNIP